MNKAKEEADKLLEEIQRSLIRNGDDMTFAYSTLSSVQVNIMGDGRYARMATLAMAGYSKTKASVRAKLVELDMEAGRIARLRGKPVNWMFDIPSSDVGVLEAKKRVMTEEFPTFKDLVIVCSWLDYADKQMHELYESAEAEAKKKRERELAEKWHANRKANEETIHDLSYTKDDDVRKMSDRDVQKLADKLRNEWRLQCDAERMEDTPNA